MTYDSRPTVRIFISSPGDVLEEREGARRVIEGLQRLYPNADLVPVLWEDLALPATAMFQETIDFLLKRKPIDIAVFILWSRLGSALGASITRPDGTPYRSGTEREFDLMLAAYEQSGQRPAILAYVREDDAGLKLRFNESVSSEWEELIRQRKLAEGFIREQFHDAEGRNLRAYQTYREPVGFVQRLRLHLRAAIDELLGADNTASWTEDPYRGLEVFDVSHAAIFHGRDEESCELLQRRRDQEQAGCAFVVIVGASGSGKSSLARAGVAASLLQNAGDDGVTREWRVSTFVPTLARQHFCEALVRSIAETLPELNDSENVLDDVARSLAENAPLTVRLSLSPAFARASEQAGGKVRWLLILDQLEELWTDPQTTSEDREQFLSAIEALARSGHVSVLATLRSDFYPHAQQMPTFLRLKGERGHYDLLPPDAASLHRLITEPARLAGVKFERDEQSGRTLDKVILNDAGRDANALPLLEYALAELYRQRDESRRLMTFATYLQLGGVEGALAKRANEHFDGLPADAQAALGEILPLLVTVDVAGERSAVRRRASVADLTSTPARKSLTDHLTAARFLTTDRQGDTPIASIAHEALLRRWDRIVDWIDANHQHLQRRARIEQNQQRWEQQNREDSLLLAAGVSLDEGRQLRENASYLLTDATNEYVNASVMHFEQQERQSRRVRTTVFSTIAVLLVALIVGGIAMKRWSEAKNRRTEADGLVDTLFSAETADVGDVLDKLPAYADLTRERLVQAYGTPEPDPKKKLHAALALLPNDESVFPFLQEQLLRVDPEAIRAVRNELEPHKAKLTETLWTLLESPTPEQQSQLLHAASALAMYDGGNEKKWTTSAKLVADALVKENSLRAIPWSKALEPVSRFLVPPLGDVFRADYKERTQSEIDVATGVLAQYVADEIGQLCELVLDAKPTQFKALCVVFERHGQNAIAKLNEELERVPPSQAPDLPRMRRRANAAAAMVRLGNNGSALPALRISDDPDSLTQFVHRCRDEGLTSAQLLKCLQIADRNRESLTGVARQIEDRCVFGLVLALGEFALDDLPAPQKTSLLKKLGNWYRDDPSSGIHGATGWLLRQWGQNDLVRQIDETPVPYDPDRGWFTLVIEADQQRFFQTYVVIPEGEYDIGSPANEPDRNESETPNRVRFTRPVAILDREITRGEFEASGVANLPIGRYSPNAAHPMVGTSWYDSVRFCRWLTQTATGFSDADQAYADPKTLDEKLYPLDPSADPPSPLNWPLDQEARGFRLPSEAEWEVACRGGMRSRFGFGSDETLLVHYGWFQSNSGRQTHVAKELRPNFVGLFDVHGSAFDWCHDWFHPYLSGVVRKDPFGSPVGSNRVSRGGSWGSDSADCRAALRGWLQPSGRRNDASFRVALVPSVEAQQIVKPVIEGSEGASGAATAGDERSAKGTREQTSRE